MGSKIVRILQIGDIHLPWWPDAKTSIDQKDEKFSEYIVQDLTQNKLSLVLKSLNKVASSGGISAAIFMGDFTSKGDVPEIAKCVKIFDTIIKDSKSDRKVEIFGVPGNHDVSLADARKLGPINKFDHLVNAFHDCDWNDPPVESCLFKVITGENGAKIDVFLINTAIGSMSVHLLPVEIGSQFNRENLDESAVEFLSQDTDERAQPDLGGALRPKSRRQQLDQLDTPYVAKNAFSSMLDFISQIEADTALVCAHHNLLPQRTPRITPYAEMLNAGLLRDCLLRTNKNIIYLHGHIHEDPVEVIYKPVPYGRNKKYTSILMVAAPPIWDGFNEVSFFCDSNSEIFLVRITEYRPDRNGNIGNFSDQKTRFFPISASRENLMTKNSKIFWDRLRDKKMLGWQEAMDLCKDIVSDADELEHLLMTLFCNEVIDIHNLGKDRKKWRIINTGGM